MFGFVTFRKTHLSHQFLLPPLLLPSLDLLGRDWISTAGLRMSVVGGPARALLRVVKLSPLGAPVLEPHLQIFRVGVFPKLS